MRKVLAIAGVFIAFAIGLVLDALVLISAIYLAKITELFFDLKIATLLKQNNKTALFKLSILKWLCIFLVLLCSLFISNITLLLLLLAALFILVTLGFTLFQTIQFNGLQGMLLNVLPLSSSALVFSLYFNIPRYVLGQADQKAILGVFTISSFILMGALVFVNTLMQSRLHALSRDLVSRHMDKFIKSAVSAFLFVAAVYALLQFFRLDFFSIPFWQVHNNLNTENPQFNRIYQLVLLMSWGPLLFSFANYFLIVQQKYKSLLVLSSFNALISLVLCSYAFDYAGFEGLMWVVNLSGLVQFFVVIMLCWHKRETA
ncbi:hypothetical protein [Paraglaciecola hydrolytica]|uniref:Uncharacterized protein n=1 Tax=Paraglaciecola hydrolytica TaxID=1799789 RepID=A0A148KMN4_9ALTE|nr:hypothetical protein [Paraglaciecola hydrolytica]KXI27550.1 hypothetical protein AX660_00930 [Paraglaciecola hydrolytica]